MSIRHAEDYVVTATIFVFFYFRHWLPRFRLDDNRHKRAFAGRTFAGLPRVRLRLTPSAHVLGVFFKVCHRLRFCCISILCVLFFACVLDTPKASRVYKSAPAGIRTQNLPLATGLIYPIDLPRHWNRSQQSYLLASFVP